MDRRRSKKGRLFLTSKRKKRSSFNCFKRSNEPKALTPRDEMSQTCNNYYVVNDDSNMEYLEESPHSFQHISEEFDDSLPAGGNADGLDSCEIEHTIAAAPVTTNGESPLTIEGRRIVDFDFFFNSLKEINNHSKIFGCSINNVHVIRETKVGFVSTFLLKCNMCNEKMQLHTSDNENINDDAVLGIMNAGSGYKSLHQLSSSLEIPCMSGSKYNHTHNKICELWEEKALDCMKEAAEEEKRIAIEEGSVDSQGTPMITVVADGSWAKRSYKKNYNSLSGAAAIVGFKTKKVLYIGVRNRFCIICKNAESKQESPKQHKCYRNWQGSASSMEADIIAEGFSKSLEMYGLIYNRLIADGDSNVYKKILDINPYENIKVRKIECKNHLLRNYSRKIRELTKDGSSGPLVLRKALEQNELRLRWAVSKAISFRKKQQLPLEERCILLKRDINNSLSHVFDEHKDCASLGYFCVKPHNSEGTLMADLKLTDLYEKLNECKNFLARHAESLIFDVDNNCVEMFNAIIAKFIGGKRVNYCQRRSYQGRCAAAVVSHNTKMPICVMKRKLTHKSPGKLTKRLEAVGSLKRKARRKLFTRGPSIDQKSYGADCEKPDLPVNDLLEAKQKFLRELQISDEHKNRIERSTIDQRNSDLWYMERRKRLTASNFAEVCKKRPATNCRLLVDRILYPRQFSAKSIQWGINNENKALSELEKQIRKPILPCGMFIDAEFPYLAASPDGLIEDMGIVEVKCPWSARLSTPELAIANKEITFWRDNRIDENHKWYFQVQGQLRITRRRYCVFAAWTPYGIKIETILRDDDFWKRKMESKLILFYNDCMLPEIIDPRKKRNMPIRDSVIPANELDSGES